MMADVSPARSPTPLQQLPLAPANQLVSDEQDNSVGTAPTTGIKRKAAEMIPKAQEMIPKAAEMSPKVIRGPSFHFQSKKPRDERLRECFTITIRNDGKESVRCRYCPSYNKVLQKFNPTKAREHLTNSCSGADEQLKQILLSTTQAAKRLLLKEPDGSSTMLVVQNATSNKPTLTEASASNLYTMKGRTSLALSFYTDGTSLVSNSSSVFNPSWTK